MAIDRINDPRAFRDFLTSRLSNGGGAFTLDEALGLWEYENQTDAERDDALQAIHRGFADVDAGRTRPAEDVIRDLFRKHKIADSTQ